MIHTIAYDIVTLLGIGVLLIVLGVLIILAISIYKTVIKTAKKK